MESQLPEFDEDGYAVGDPYSEACKIIDRKQKADKNKSGAVS
jgi:hypothetical protein